MTSTAIAPSATIAPRTARHSFSREEYVCQFPWPADAMLQCGGQPIHPRVPASGRPAFFEAFPRASTNGVDAYLRGEGDTLAAAEADAWAQQQAQVACAAAGPHRFVRVPGREDGYAECVVCAVRARAFEPTTRCHTCGIPAHYGQDKDDNWYCKPHAEALPEELQPAWRRELRAMEEELEANPLTAEDISACITGLAAALGIDTPSADPIVRASETATTMGAGSSTE